MQQQRAYKKSPLHNLAPATTTYKSPYFSSVHRNRNKTENKNRISASAQNALHITKYPSLNKNDNFQIENTYEKSYGKDQKNVRMGAVEEVEGDGIGVGRKKKVFKRFNKFQQVDQMYGYPYEIEEKKIADRKDKKLSEKRDQMESETQVHSREYTSANPKAILYSNKTLALMQKYSSYKSILLSTPKNSKTRSKSKQQSKQSIGMRNFRTKIKSGNTIQWNHRSREDMERVAEKQRQREKSEINMYENDDWLCKQLIKNQVYGVDEDDCF